MAEKETEEAVEILVDAHEDIAAMATASILGLEEDEEDEDEDEEEEDEENERTKINDMWSNLIHSGLTLYTIWTCLIVHVPVGASPICRAAHMIVVPLFKPATLSLWPALMPLIQFAHWQFARKSKHPEDYAKMSVRPGTQRRTASSPISFPPRSTGTC